ncbi:MAG TPA: hypothetical protein VGE15_09335 [Sphingobacteriaceae bacterium]
MNGKSCVCSYQIGTNYILVGFTSGSLCVYTYTSVGREDVEAMKRFAIAGRGLGDFIGNLKNRNSRKLSSFLGRVPGTVNSRLRMIREYARSISDQG